MTYKDRFVAEVKSQGQILRVSNDTVFLPFKSEYSILLKNLNSRKACVSVEIDGQDVLDYNKLILHPNETSELMGFLSGNTVKNRFLFIQKTKQIQDHRGDKIEDGIIRIEFAFEKPQQEPWIKDTIKEVHHHYHGYPYTYKYYGNNSEWSYTSENNSGNVSRGISDGASVYNCTFDSLGMTSQPQQDEGITVKGSEINQNYTYGSIGELESSQVIVLKLKGITNKGAGVSQPLTVKSKLTCSTCGTKSKSSAKYCSACGTYLH